MRHEVRRCEVSSLRTRYGDSTPYKDLFYGHDTHVERKLRLKGVKWHRQGDTAPHLPKTQLWATVSGQCWAGPAGRRFAWRLGEHELWSLSGPSGVGCVCVWLVFLLSGAVWR